MFLRKIGAVLLLIVLLASAGAGAELVVDGLEEQPINRTFSGDGVAFTADYLNLTIPWKNVTYPDELHGYLAKWTISTTDKNNSFEMDFQSEWNGSAPDGLAGRKVNEKLSVKKGETKSTLVNGSFEDGEGVDAVNVTAEAHYEHLVLTYEVMNSSGDVVETYENVYSDDDPERVTFGESEMWQSYLIGTGYMASLASEYDNLFDERKNLTVVVAHSERYSIREMLTENVSSIEEVNSSGIYDRVEQRAVEANLSGEILLNDTSGMSFTAYNATVEADKVAEFMADIKTEVNASGKAYMWILGSVGGVSGTMSTQGGFPGNQIYNVTIDPLSASYDGSVHEVLIGSDGSVYVSGDEDVGSEFGDRDPWIAKFYPNGTNEWVSTYQPDENGQKESYGGLVLNDDESVLYGVGEVGEGGGIVKINASTGAGMDWARPYYPGDFHDAVWYEGNIYAVGYQNNADPRFVKFNTDLSVACDYKPADGAYKSITEYGGLFYVLEGITMYEFNTGCSQTGKTGTVSGIDDADALGAEQDYVWAWGDEGGAVAEQLFYRSNLSAANNGKNYGGELGSSNPSGTDIIPDGNGNAYASFRKGGSGGMLKTYGGNDDWIVRWSETGGDSYGAESGYRDGEGALFGATTAGDYFWGFKWSFNSAPSITETLWVNDKRNGVSSINNTVDDAGEADVSSYSGAGSLLAFTNSTLDVSMTLPFATTFSVSDSQGAVSSDVTVNVSESDSGVRAGAGGATFDSQSLNRTVTLFNNDTSLAIDYQLNLSLGTGSDWSGTITAGGSVTHTATETGDWMEQESNSSVYFGSGSPRIGVGVGTNYTAMQGIAAKNNRTDGVTLPIEASEWIGSAPGCSLVNGTTLNYGAGVVQNKTVHFDCDPGSEKSYTPVVKTETANDYVYEYNAVINVTSDIPSEQEYEYCFEETRLDSWERRSPDRTAVAVDDNTDDLSLKTKSISSTEYVCLTVGDQHTQSSLHVGEHDISLTYYESKDTGQTGTGGGGGGGSETVVVENVSGEYEWTVSALSGADQDFQFYGHPGDERTVTVELENTGDKPVTLELDCISGAEVCDTVSIGTKSVEFDEQNFTSTTVDISYKIPSDLNKSSFNFRIRVTDPSWSEGSSEGVAYLDFQIDTANPWLSKFLDRGSRLFSLAEFKPPFVPADAGGVPVPFFLLPLIPSALVFVLLRTFSDARGGVLFGQVLVMIGVFVVLLFAIPPL